jgi:hypothetical protein
VIVTSVLQFPSRLEATSRAAGRGEPFPPRLPILCGTYPAVVPLVNSNRKVKTQIPTASARAMLTEVTYPGNKRVDECR